MKTYIFAAIAALLLPSVSQAQDDLYFVPSKKNVDKSEAEFGLPRNTYYSGSRRSVDDYNRYRPRVRSHVEAIDSAGNKITEYTDADIIDFDGAMGIYPDSAAIDTAFSVDPDGDYSCTRRMSRFDDYAWQDGYRDGYYACRASSWYWNDPWYWDYPYYGYASWYWGSPYYYGWYWNDPWYWGGWYGHHHHYYGGGYIAGGGTHSGWRTGMRRGSFRGTRGTTTRGGSFGGQRTGTSSSRSSSFGGSRRSSYSNSTFSGTRNSSFNSSSSGSFGGSHSSGSFGGGGSRGGGFGGGGSRGGGGGRR